MNTCIETQKGGEKVSNDNATRAWAYTLEQSIMRTNVRAYPDCSNTTVKHRISDGMPNAWAVYLCDDSKHYNLLCFDFDAHNNSDEERNLAVSQSEELCLLLDEKHIEYTLCQSGPSGGRHVWISMIDKLEASFVRNLAYASKNHYSTLDITPLLNTSEGCARPPLSPHHLGGYSRVIRGRENIICYATTSEQQIIELLNVLESTQPSLDVIDTSIQENIVCLQGAKRSLSHATRILLQTRVTNSTDTSVLLWRIMLGCVCARYKFEDVLPLVVSYPKAFTHALSVKVSSNSRKPRSQAQAQAILKYTWKRAVSFLTKHDTVRASVAMNDQTYIERTQKAVEAIHILWQILEAHNSKSIKASKASDTRVLMALAYFMLQANSLTVEADTRRLALHTGLSRQTVSVALRRLVGCGAVCLSRKSEGRHGAVWSMCVKSLQSQGKLLKLDTSGNTPPFTADANTVTTVKNYLLSTISKFLQIVSHDACTYRGIGIKNGNKLAYELMQTLDISSISQRLNYLAEQHSCVGIVENRKNLYTLERKLYAWYLQELNFMKLPIELKRTLSFARMPRNDEKKIDFMQARAYIKRA